MTPDTDISHRNLTREAQYHYQSEEFSILQNLSCGWPDQNHTSKINHCMSTGNGHFLIFLSVSQRSDVA